MKTITPDQVKAAIQATLKNFGHPVKEYNSFSTEYVEELEHIFTLLGVSYPGLRLDLTDQEYISIADIIDMCRPSVWYDKCDICGSKIVMWSEDIPQWEPCRVESWDLSWGGNSRYITACEECQNGPFMKKLVSLLI